VAGADPGEETRKKGKVENSHLCVIGNNSTNFQEHSVVGAFAWLTKLIGWSCIGN